MVIKGATYLTAGARAERLTIAKPAARTAVACNSPSMIRTPTGIESMAGLPISRRRKKIQSVALRDEVQSCVEDCTNAHFKIISTVRRNQVWCDGKR